MRMAARIGAVVFVSLCAALMLHAQYSLELIQRFPENSAGKSNQAKFADVDGDGQADLVASYTAPGNVGQVIGIWFNHGTKFSDSVDVTINLTFKNKQCWFNVGDVNGDGMADIVAMSQYGGHYPPKIVLGRASWPETVTTPDVACQYPVDPDWSSGAQYTSITIGDFDNDGYNDIVFPEQGTRISLGDYGGRMVMYKGGSTVSPTPSMVFMHPGNSRGYAMGPPPDTALVYLRWFSPFISKGDFNGDGIQDIFTSGYYSWCNFKLFSVTSNRLIQMDNTGAGVVFFGGADLDTIPDVIMVPPDDFLQYTSLTDWMYCGYWVFNAGDISGDGADDFSLPSWYWAINFVYKGLMGMPQVPSEFQTLVLRDPFFYFTKNRYSQDISDQNGTNLLPVGDITGDGVPDLGNARNYYGSGPDEPGIRLFFGSKTAVGAVDPDIVSTEYSQVQESNRDFDGDGRVDLVLSDLDSRLCLVKLILPTSVRDDWRKNAPREFVLAQNYPNPFNPTTQIAYYLPYRTHVTLAVYNGLGQLMETLVDEEQSQGAQQVTFDARSYASGSYFYRLTAGGFTETRMMTIVK